MAAAHRLNVAAAHRPNMAAACPLPNMAAAHSLIWQVRDTLRGDAEREKIQALYDQIDAANAKLNAERRLRCTSPSPSHSPPRHPASMLPLSLPLATPPPCLHASSPSHSPPRHFASMLPLRLRLAAETLNGTREGEIEKLNETVKDREADLRDLRGHLAQKQEVVDGYEQQVEQLRVQWAAEHKKLTAEQRELKAAVSEATLANEKCADLIEQVRSQLIATDCH